MFKRSFIPPRTRLAKNTFWGTLTDRIQSSSLSTNPGPFVICPPASSSLGPGCSLPPLRQTRCSLSALWCLCQCCAGCLAAPFSLVHLGYLLILEIRCRRPPFGVLT